MLSYKTSKSLFLFMVSICRVYGHISLIYIYVAFISKVLKHKTIILPNRNPVLPNNPPFAMKKT